MKLRKKNQVRDLGADFWTKGALYQFLSDYLNIQEIQFSNQVFSLIRKDKPNKSSFDEVKG